MIDITDGFTSISAGSDSIEGAAQDAPGAPGNRTTPRVPTGARVTVEFRRETSLAPEQLVRARYDFADDGNVREATGIAKPIRTVVRQGRAVLFYYRLSHWIAPTALMNSAAGEVRSRTEQRQAPAQPRLSAAPASAPLHAIAYAVPANDPIRA
jgi:hypothetical protein